MDIFPAIDLRGGRVVRLFQGDYDKQTVYADNALHIAEAFASRGATNLHIIDLDGALAGEPTNFDLIASLVKNSGFFVQVGGGIRSQKRIEDYLNLGVGRVILGTSACDVDFLSDMLALYGDRIAVGVDAKGGKVAVRGWRQVTDLDALSFCRDCRALGVKTVIYTDIERDGASAGTNLAVYRDLKQIEGLDIIASGGISFEDEITALKTIGVKGAVVGKAIYDDKLDLSKIIKLAGEDGL